MTKSEQQRAQNKPHELLYLNTVLFLNRSVRLYFLGVRGLNLLPLVVSSRHVVSAYRRPPWLAGPSLATPGGRGCGEGEGQHRQLISR